MEAGVPIGAQPYPDPDDVQAEATVLRMLLGAQLRRLRGSDSRFATSRTCSPSTG
jgi:hypothetical protein